MPIVCWIINIAKLYFHPRQGINLIASCNSGISSIVYSRADDGTQELRLNCSSKRLSSDQSQLFQFVYINLISKIQGIFINLRCYYDEQVFEMYCLKQVFACVFSQNPLFWNINILDKLTALAMDKLNLQSNFVVEKKRVVGGISFFTKPLHENRKQRKIA